MYAYYFIENELTLCITGEIVVVITELRATSNSSSLKETKCHLGYAYVPFSIYILYIVSYLMFFRNETVNLVSGLLVAST